MKIQEVKSLVIPAVKVVKYERFADHRGYFTETFRLAEIQTNLQLSFLKDAQFSQFNESFSKKGVIKGLHFQWNPYMGKLVRVSKGHMIDLFLDIRKGSPTYGKVAAYEMAANESDEINEWIWIPVGFAHGNFYPQDTTIEYFCTGQWAPETERGISPLAPDLDWSLCDPALKQQYDEFVKNNPLMTDKDKNGLKLQEWGSSPDAELFTYSS